MRSYLLVLGEREAVAWVLRQQQMAFPERRRTEVQRLEPGDELLIYTTRGCWHNPTRDRGRIIGRAYVTSPVSVLDKPVELAGRAFTSGCDIDVRTLVPYRTGVELAPLVGQLAAFPRKTAWSTRLRRPLLELPSSDAMLVRDQLAGQEVPAAEQLSSYLEAIKRA
ncbi:hypothetical protein FNQ90_03925 [Streptomyces alkaliphilus]|uniref:EVE domain-containing protein n=1 Tax=Streptomyces alkaliphilus TaxID=1472722 RepID=A0A7W3Y067_9ACTN|nr:hypothetical protein [Streptomyces alkaliphilus]